MKCPSCSAENPAGNRFCGACAAPLIAGSRSPTEAMPRPPSSSSVDEGRFLPGTLLAERYRIIGLLGRGGMGEVYRATDLKLGQPVALKFLPESTARDERVRARFHNEVRIARQVSHPNVCRVYDIGEVDGAPYISMEYVDGEDLGSLLRRIGRLPADKATEIARRLCAGLAAAHDRGVLHRDLKPANVMIDGRGHVLITDFGLAGLSDQLTAADARSGTPAYMAPEQLAGREVSVKSDIYSLGLVLYEMFTGKRAYQANSLAELQRMQNESAPTSLASIVKDLEPAVERVILRCLQAEPRNRPGSALAVAAALPGGDPLAAALAAGETPSPEMVAAAGETEGMRVGVAIACLAAVVVGLALAVCIVPGTRLTSRVELEHPPEALKLRARDILKRFGYTSRSIDNAHGFYAMYTDFARYLEQHDPSPRRWDRIGSHPELIRYWYRESPRYLVAGNWLNFNSAVGEVTSWDPPQDFSGMTTVTLDFQGRLVYFEAVPPQVDASPVPAQPFDGQALFDAAGLDLRRFTPAEPQWSPPTASDARAAWTGTFADAPDKPLRVEAASWRGRPVFFQMVWPWTRPARMQPYQMTRRDRALNIFFPTVLSLVFGAGLLLARHNVRAGRGDRRGAFRLAGLMFFAEAARWLLLGNHAPEFSEFIMIGYAAGYALYWAALIWVLYMALEPLVRRRWPQALIGWNRVLAGSLRDPLVGRDLLLGTVYGMGFILLYTLSLVTDRAAGAQPQLYSLDPLLGARHLAGLVINQMSVASLPAMGVFMILFLARLVVRKEWLAGLICVLLLVVGRALQSTNLAAAIPLAAIGYGAGVLVLTRFGLLAFGAGIFVSNLAVDLILTRDFSAWYASSTIFAIVAILALAGYGFHATLAGRPIFKGEILQD